MFSEKEQKVVDILRQNRQKAISIKDLTDKFYKSKLPFNANNKVAGHLRRVKVKCEHHGLKWTIEGSGLGRGGRMVWIKQRRKAMPKGVGYGKKRSAKKAGKKVAKAKYGKKAMGKAAKSKKVVGRKGKKK